MNVKYIEVTIHELFLSDDVKDSNTTSTMLFPESEIVIEPEPTQEQISKEDKSELEVVATEEIDKGYSTKELENMALKETKDDKHFLCFKERIGLEPEQVSDTNSHIIAKLFLLM